MGIKGVFVKPKLVVGTEAKLRQTDLTKDIQVQPKKKKKKKTLSKSTSRYVSKELKISIQIKICIQVFIAAIFTTGKRWRQLKHPSMDELIKMVCLYYSAMKRNEALVQATTS